MRDIWKQVILGAFGFVMLASSVHAEESFGWNFNPAKNNEPPSTEPLYVKWLNQYKGYYIGNTDEKELYLTFDNGYENGFTEPILDVLKERNVPAAFFVTGHYVQSEPDLINRMAKEGHIVANHSWSHPHFPDLSDEQIKVELERVEDAYTELTGNAMHYVRPPRGTFNERTLDAALKLGYTHVFWSFAYVDWNTDDQKGEQYAYDKIMDRIHPGAIVLLHSVSEDNALALGRVIDDLKAQGYTFKSLDDLTGKRSSSPLINARTSAYLDDQQSFVAR